LQHNMRQVTLAERSGVSLASLKRFELTGQVSLSSLLKIANALGCLDDFSALFLPKPATTISDLEKIEKKKQRCRGRG
jgi:transcriptional regulator with XRE-family HTH domain